MFGDVTAIYIDDSNIRLLVMKGKRVKRRAVLPLEPGDVEGGVVIKEEEVAARLREFLKAKRIKAKKVITGLSGLHNLTRPIQLPRLSQELLAEAVLREAKRVMPIAPEQFFIMWQTIPAPAGKTGIYVSAIRSRSVDSVVRMLKKAGLNPVMMDLKPLALTRLIKEKTAIIIDVQPTEFDIVIMSDGVPQPLRTMPFPGEAEDWSQKLVLIKMELERTIEFFNSNNPEKVLDSTIPVHISGEIACQPDLEAYLPDELGHPVVPLSSRLKSVKDRDYNNYMVNVGLSMLDSSLAKSAGPSVVNSNLLPPVYRPKPIPLFRLIALPSTVTIIVMLVPMLILARNTSANIASLHTQIDTANRLILQEQRKKNELKQELATKEALYQTLSSALDKFQNQHEEINNNLDTTFENLLGNITLKTVKHVSDSINIEGLALDEADVLSYASALETSSRFTEVIVSSIKTDDDGDKEFTLILKTKGWE